MLNEPEMFDGTAPVLCPLYINPDMSVEGHSAYTVDEDPDGTPETPVD